MATSLYIRCVAAVAAAVALAAPTVAAARGSSQTHRFAPAPEVTVSFALAKHRVSGEIIRFASNRVSIVRSRKGMLRLRAKGQHTRHLAASGHRRSRVVVRLSSASGQVTMQVGRKAARLRGQFRAEGAVVIRTRAVVDLRIATNFGAVASRIATSPGAATGTQASPAPTPAPPASVPRLFAPDSVWNAPLAPTAPLDPSNATLVRTLQNTVAQNIAAGWGPWIGTDGTSPLYTVPAHQPTVRVTLDAGAWNGALQRALDAVPMPPDAQPAAGPDGHLTVWQPSTDRMWELFQARSMADGWHASYGGAMANVSRSPGYYDASSWPGLSQPSWGATATSLPVIAGTIMINELKAGVIPHALALNIPWARPNVYSWPAQRTDGQSTDPNAIPEGARFRLDPTVDLARLSLPPMTRMMAVAAQQYGMIVRDQTGHAVSFFAENPAQYGTDPYTSPGGFYGAPNPSAVMRAFPWQYVQLVRMDLRTAG